MIDTLPSNVSLTIWSNFLFVIFVFLLFELADQHDRMSLYFQIRGIALLVLEIVMFVGQAQHQSSDVCQDTVYYLHCVFVPKLYI